MLALTDPPPGGAEMCVVLTPRTPGGHEVALFAWLADAVRTCGLRPAIVAPGAALAEACAGAGLERWRWSGASPLSALRRWPPNRPVLLAPGVLHAQAWLLAAAVLLRRRVWVYVPMTYRATDMAYRAGAQRDRLLQPWLAHVEAWITIDDRQAALLQAGWGVRTPVHRLPNRARVRCAGPDLPPPSADGRLRVAIVGRFEPWQKGLDWLAALIRSEYAWRAGFRWRFQGRGAGAPALHALAAAVGSEHVEVHDHAPLDAALACSDVLLLPSRYEGLPLVALETIARGWPVVASRSSNLEDLILATSVFDFGDARGMVGALDGLRDRDARGRAVRHARARMRVHDVEAGYQKALREVTQALQRTCEAHGRGLGVTDFERADLGTETRRETPEVPR